LIFRSQIDAIPDYCYALCFTIIAAHRTPCHAAAAIDAIATLCLITDTFFRY